MWKKFYTNSGLILLAVLAAGVWTSNLRSIYQPAPEPCKYTDFDRVTTTPSPSPMPYGDDTPEVKPEDLGKPIRTPEIFVFRPETLSEKIWRIVRGRWIIDRRRPIPNATAIFKDGSYSYSSNHSGACSHHGGVAQWLSR